TVVRAVTHHFELDFLPSRDALLEEDLADHAEFQAFAADIPEFLHVVGYPAAGAAQRVCRPYYYREADFFSEGDRIVQVRDDGAHGHLFTDVLHRLLEQFPVLRLLYRHQRRSEQFYAIAVEYAVIGKLNRHVEAGLASEGREYPVRSFTFDYLFDHVYGYRLDIDAVGRIPVRHDGG